MSGYHDPLETYKSSDKNNGEVRMYSRELEKLCKPLEEAERLRIINEWRKMSGKPSVLPMKTRDVNLAEATERPVERKDASGRENVPPTRETRSAGKFEGVGAILRDRWVVVAAIVAVAAIVVAYIMRPSRYRVMGEHNRYIFDSQTGKAYLPSGKEVKYP